MIAALQLIEGAAYRPEAFERSGRADTNDKPYEDNGTFNGVKSNNDDILAGAVIGQSKQHTAYVKSLWEKIAPGEDFSKLGYHGAGSRFFKDTRIAERCIDFLPTGAPEVGDISPNFDVDMDLIGWYDTKDQSGGQNTWLKKTGANKDDREVQKYYKRKNGDWLFAFDVKYE